MTGEGLELNFFEGWVSDGLDCWDSILSPGRARGWLFDMLVTIVDYDLPGDKVSGFPRCSGAFESLSCASTHCY